MDECRRLAREGEKATRMGDAAKGIELLEKALQVGTDDIPFLSAIYSQLGNAYYAQKLYEKAKHYHARDLSLSRMENDRVQQAKAYSNMSATFTMLNEFDQALSCANNVIQLGQKLNDKGLECRGLYNLGLAHLQNAIQGDLDETDEMKTELQEAVMNFEKHLELAKERNDEILCGLAIGNLGNAYFYLGDYEKSVVYHLKRMDIARAIGDKSSMRRSYTNMGNAYVLLGKHDEAERCYRNALEIANETGRKNLSAQLNFSLGNVEMLRGKYNDAIDAFRNHLRYARELKDSAGESRANSSLASAFAQLHDYPKSLYFLVSNYNLAKKLGEESMKRNALEEIKKLVKRNPESIIKDDRVCLDGSFDPENDDMTFDTIGSGGRADSGGGKNNQLEVPYCDALLNNSVSAFSMPNLSVALSLESFIRDCAENNSSTPKKASLIPLSSAGSILPTPKHHYQSHSHNASHQQLQNPSTMDDSIDVGLSRVMCKSVPNVQKYISRVHDNQSPFELFDEIQRVQNKRLDDQRAGSHMLEERSTDQHRNSDNVGTRSSSDNPDTILDLIESIQGRRMNEQRADLLPGLNDAKQVLEKFNFGSRRHSEGGNVADGDNIDERLYELIVQSQADRLEDQRSELGGRSSAATAHKSSAVSSVSSLNAESMVSDLVQKMQVGRINDQRATFGGAVSPSSVSGGAFANAASDAGSGPSSGRAPANLGALSDSGGEAAQPPPESPLAIA